jgi:hypothetical protein
MVHPDPLPGVDDQLFDEANRFLDALSPRHSGWNGDPGGWVYRGQAQATWRLLAKAMRSREVFREFGISGPSTNWSERADRLNELLDDFRSRLNQSGLRIPDRAPDVYWIRETYSNAEPKPEVFPLMALAQHHMLPTTLLDWTRRAWAAAYFAASDAAAVSRYPSGSFLVVWALQRAAFADDDDFHVFYQAPGGTNPNLNAQAGLFTHHHAEEDWPLDVYLNKLRENRPSVPTLQRYLLPIEQAPRLLRLLALEGITGSSMFPGTDGVVRALRERALWDEPEKILPGRRHRS